MTAFDELQDLVELQDLGELKDLDENHQLMDFIKTQEPLGSRFEKILHENLWELYES